MTEQPKVCQVHPIAYRHRPAIVGPLEFHHLRPREWQRSLIDLAKSDPLTDTVAWLPGVTPPTIEGVPLAARWSGAYGWVFDTNGITAGRTCHGNVHAGIVALTHAWKPGDDPHLTLARARTVTGRPRLDTAEWSAATLALAGWTAAGQTVEWLLERELWGAL